MMASRDRAEMPPGWMPAAHWQRCNFHGLRPAARLLYGTPVCEDCSRRVGWLRDLEAHRARVARGR